MTVCQMTRHTKKPNDMSRKRGHRPSSVFDREADIGFHELEGKRYRPCRVSHKEGDMAVPSEDRVGGSAIQEPVRDTRSLLQVLANAVGKETTQICALSTAVLY